MNVEQVVPRDAIPSVEDPEFVAADGLVMYDRRMPNGSNRWGERSPEHSKAAS